MKPPTCRICGTAHWSSDPHALTPLLTPEQPPVNTSAKIAKDRKVDRHRDGYMRDYMRKRRGGSS